MAKIYVVSGIPLHGKSSVARILSARTGIRHQDIDDHIRTPHFGAPDPAGDTLSGISDTTGGAAYRILFEIAETHLELGWDLIITATFIRPKRQALLENFYSRHPAAVMIIRCQMSQDGDEELQRRMVLRAGAYSGGVESLSEYRKVSAAAQPLSLPHLIIDTSAPKTAEQAADEAMAYFFPA